MYFVESVSKKNKSKTSFLCCYTSPGNSLLTIKSTTASSGLKPVDPITMETSGALIRNCKKRDIMEIKDDSATILTHTQYTILNHNNKRILKYWPMSTKYHIPQLSRSLKKPNLAWTKIACISQDLNRPLCAGSTWQGQDRWLWLRWEVSISTVDHKIKPLWCQLFLTLNLWS